MNIIKTKVVICLHFRSIRIEKLPTIIHKDGKCEYYENRKFFNISLRVLHRPSLEGPAVIFPNDDQNYYKNGFLHRPSSEGPAVIGMNGYKAYYKNGKVHRSSPIPSSSMDKDHSKVVISVHAGPAVIFQNGDEIYYNNGISYINPKK
ncbi:MAG: hypothetical protein JKX76_00920 [Colwellia sp.]|nr:hypothetical protein [Colwellia sp.]